MRTTLTLDDDVAARLKAEARRSGRPFRDVVNEMLRRGLTPRSPGAQRRPPFKAAVRDLGELKPGLSLDDVAGLLEQVEGPLHR
jgi:plasmid stability protein